MTAPKLLELSDPIDRMMEEELRRAQAIGMAHDEIFFRERVRRLPEPDDHGEER